MVSGLTVPEFSRGQVLLARDFAALVGAVRDLLHWQMPVLGQWRGGRYYRSFVPVGRCVPRKDGDGEEVACAAEVLFQVGNNVTLCEDSDVDGVKAALELAAQKGVPCGLHAEVKWERDGGMEGYTMRAAGMECCAAAWVEPEVGEDGRLKDEGQHGGVVFSAVLPRGQKTARGCVQCVPAPWVMPQCPGMIWRSEDGESGAELCMGEMFLLPAGQDEEQVLCVRSGGYEDDEGVWHGVYHEWRGRLDRHGLLHVRTQSREA